VSGPVTPTVGRKGGLEGFRDGQRGKERGGLAVDLRTGWPDGPGGFLRKEEGPEESVDGGEVAGDLRTELVRGVRETLRKERRSRGRSVRVRQSGKRKTSQSPLARLWTNGTLFDGFQPSDLDERALRKAKRRLNECIG
jgi:hypothetical protein